MADDDMIPQVEQPDRLDATPVPVPPQPQQIPMTGGGRSFANIDALAKEPIEGRFIPTDTPAGFAVTPGALDVDHGSDAPVERPWWEDTFRAELRHGNQVASFLSNETNRSYNNVDPSFNAWESIRGTPYEQYWPRFTEAGNEGYANAIKRQIDKEQSDQKTIALAPWWQQLAFGAVASGVDLSSLLPGGAFVKGARGGISIARSALATGAAAGLGIAEQEAVLHATQQTRTMGESVQNVGMGVLLGGILGAGGAGLMSHAEWSDSIAKLNADLDRAGSAAPTVMAGPGEPAAAGAAPVERPKIDDLSIAGRAAGGLAKVTENMSPALRLLQSDSPVVRYESSRLFENSVYMKQNFAGVASAPAVETLMKEWNGGLATALRATNDAFSDYRKAGGTLKADEFRQEVGKAMRRGDAADIPQVQKVAQQWRSQVFDPLKEAAIKAGLLPEDVSVDTATSYFSRMWNRNRLNAQEGRFKQIVSDYYGGAMRNDFVEGAQSFKQRMARLDQETSDLGLSGDDRGYMLNRMEARRNELLANQPMQDMADRLSELRSSGREARQRGDSAAIQAAADETARIRQQGGPALEQHLAELAEINRRHATISMNAEGLNQRATRIYSQMADLEEANQRSMGRLVQKGQALQRELQRLDPDKLRERVSQIRDAFEAESERIAKTSERLAKASKQEAMGGVPPAPKGPAPRTLIAFLREHGGLKDETGDLKAAGHADRKGFIRKSGLSLDKARQLAAEAGYLGPDIDHAMADTTPNDLLDAISNHPSYSVRDEHAVDARFMHGRGLENRKQAGAAYDHIIETLDRERGLSEREVNHLAVGDAVHRVMAGEDPLEAYDHALHEHADREAQGLGAGSQRLDRIIAAQNARVERLADIADRLRSAEGFDRQGVIDELNAAVDKLKEEVSNVSMSRGEKRAALLDRMRKLDPARVEERLKRIEQMRRDIERRFYDRWEVDRQGSKLDIGNPHTADFSEAARDIANEVHSTLTGRGAEGPRPEFLTVNSRGPMKDRTFNIPDALIEDFLEHDVEHVGRRYTRVMGADVEMAHKFGSPDLKEPLQRIADDYALMRSKVTDEKTLLKLAKAEKDDVRDVTALRDLLRGTYQPHSWDRSFGKIIRTANAFNYIRSMGEVVLASLPDALRPAQVHGLSRYMQTIPQLVTNLNAIKMSVREAQKAGNVLEGILGHRLATISEMADPYSSRSPLDAFMHNMTETANKWNGIRLWTDGMKSFAAVMTQNRLVENALQGFDRLKPREQAYMAYLGIDKDMAERVAAQFREHGETIGGVQVPGTEGWTDEVARRTFRAAMNKDVDSIIVQPSVADVPLFAHTPAGKAFLQFKSFTLASHQRVILRGLQEGQARFLGGIIAMTALGMFQTWLKAVSGNRLDKMADFQHNPGWWIGEGLDRSGALGALMEVANTFEKITSVNPIKSPMKAFDDTSQISLKNQNRSQAGSLAGPSAGTVGDISTVLGIPSSMAQGQDVSDAQKRAAVRLLPFNTFAGVRQFLNYIIMPAILQHP